MSIRFLPLSLLFLIACNNRHSDEISLKLIPVKQGEYWGYIDQDGKVAINPQFKSAYTFREGLALFENTEGKYGYIDEKGNIVINAVYKNAGAFNEGLAAVVKENQRIEFIDRSGKTALTLGAEIETATGFKEGRARVQISGKPAYINKEGKVVINASQFSESYTFSDGLALVSQVVKDEEKYGFIDKDGKVAITPQFEGAGPFYDGMAMIRMDKKYGFINKEGKIVITPQFESAREFSEGLCPVQQGELWGFVDEAGKFVINPQYKWTHGFNKAGLCPVKATTNDKWGFIDKKGKMVIEPQFESVTNFYDDVAVVGLNEKYGVIGKEGKYLVNPTYEDYIIIPYSYVDGVESDFFDISSISGMLFRDVTGSGVRGIRPTSNFTTLQAQFSGLAHDNYSSYKDFELEANISLELKSINFVFNEGFASYATKYKTERRYNYYTYQWEDYQAYDGYTTSYNDATTLKGVVYEYDLVKKALARSEEIIDLLKKKAPEGFVMSSPDANTLTLVSTAYNLEVIRKDNKLYFVIRFDEGTTAQDNQQYNQATEDSVRIADSIRAMY